MPFWLFESPVFVVVPPSLPKVRWVYDGANTVVAHYSGVDTDAYPVMDLFVGAQVADDAIEPTVEGGTGTITQDGADGYEEGQEFNASLFAWLDGGDTLTALQVPPQRFVFGTPFDDTDAVAGDFDWRYDGDITVTLRYYDFGIPVSLAGSDPDSSPTLSFSGDGVAELAVGNVGDPGATMFGAWLWPSSEGVNGGGLENRLYFNGVFNGLGDQNGDNTLEFGTPSSGSGSYPPAA